ncbi:MAG: amino acid aminotransferase [Burkholderiaceae bacterium]
MPAPAPSMFAAVELAPRDPILGLTEQFVADPNPAKVNLGVGVYFDADGKLPLLRCVQEAERQMVDAVKPRGYLPIDGIAAYDGAVQSLVFGAGSALLTDGRVATVQTLGGTGGLKVGADFLARLDRQAVVWISDPSWENHRALFEAAGFTVRAYPYYDAARRGVDVDAMLETLAGLPPGSIVVLHACCHNPTGYDLDPDQWRQVLSVVQTRGLVPFLDMAYQGFADGIAEDRAVIDLFAASGLDFFVSTSFSKSFSLYGERVGALCIVCASRDEATRVLSQLKRVIRTNYSNPPTHGAQIVATVLGTPALRAIWEDELTGMRLRIRAMRSALRSRLEAGGLQRDFGFITRQRGMFSYSGMSVAQMHRLRAEFGIYGIDSGRICVAALNEHNLDAVVQAIIQVS